MSDDCVNFLILDGVRPYLAVMIYDQTYVVMDMLKVL